MENEAAFAAEAQDEAILSRRRSRPSRLPEHRSQSSHSDDSEDPAEGSPLLPGKSDTSPSVGKLSVDSYERAINEPWLGARGSEGLPWYKKPSILWLLPAFLPSCLAFGSLIVPRTYLVLDLICRDYLEENAAKDPHVKFMPVIFGSENPQCRDPAVQARVATFQLYSSLLSGIFAAIVSPHLGALSDRIGRKRVIAFATLGTFVLEIMTIVVGTHPDTVSVYWILVGYLLDGLCGSFTTSMALSFAYASDCTPPERRNVAFGYFHGTLFTGVAIGPILAGYLIQVTGNVMVCFYFAVGCHVFFILFLLIAIPESVSKERQEHAREHYQFRILGSEYSSYWKILKNWNLFGPLNILWPKGEGSSFKLRKNLALLAAIDATVFGVAMGTVNIILIYAEFMFGWDPVKSSMFLSSVNICRVFALVVGLPLVTRLFRGPVRGQHSAHHGADRLDINVIHCAILFDLLGYVGYASVQTGVLMILSGMVAALGGVGSPTLQSALTKHVPASVTGQILGATGLLHALARIVAPTIFSLIYRQTVHIFPRTVFVCLASTFFVVSIMTWFLKPNVYLHDSAAPGAAANEDEQEDIGAANLTRL